MNSSNSLKEGRSIDKIRKLLMENGCPRKLLDRLQREIRNKRVPAKRREDNRQAQYDGFLCLPYVDEELLCKIKSKVRNCGLNVKIAWRNQNKLRDKLVRSALVKPTCPGGISFWHKLAGGISSA